MPCFQDSIGEVYPDTLVMAIGLNHDAPNANFVRDYLVNYIGYIGTSYKADTLTYPVIWDPLTTTFEAYGLTPNLLPAIFLVDQTGYIRIASYGASTAATFWPEFDLIMTEIRVLLENPPTH
jgi:hypothetical protein